MSAAIVRKALEISEDAPSTLEKRIKNSGQRKLKLIEKRQKAKLTPEALLKKNVRILKALEFSSRAKKYGKIEKKEESSSKASLPAATPLSSASESSKKGNKKKKKKKGTEESSSVFTEEDFEKFEKEYFVTD